MTLKLRLLNPAVAAILAALIALPLAAQDAERESELLAQLADPEVPRWQRVERELLSEWSKSGSPAMDLLLQRGRVALQSGDTDAAIEHLTALTDHAPEFAEGYNARATAYFQAGRFGPSMEDLARALSLNPNHFGALSGLGLILEETGFFDRALAAFRAAHAIHPNQPGIKASLERLERKVAGLEI
jgi:tetratricopeptide (TPR) repeat protein